MTSSSEPKWKSLRKIPNIFNDQGFNTAYNAHTQSLFAVHQDKGLMQYLFDANEWKTYTAVDKLPSSFFTFGTRPMAVDSKQKIYCCSAEGLLAIIQINPIISMTEKWEIIASDHKFHGAQAVMVDDELHVIGGWKDPKHFKYNNSIKKFELLHKLPFGYPKLIKLKHDHDILSFGGYFNWRYISMIYINMI